VKELTREQESEIYQAQAIYEHAKQQCSPKAVEEKYGITRKQRIEVVKRWRTEKR
jgi:hypothetical protein